MKVVLISTYELGRQPFGLASPAAWLRARGHEVECADLAVAPFPTQAVRDAGLVAFYLPMHTATRLAARPLSRVRGLNGSAHVAAYGLYAPMNEEFLRSFGVSTIIGGEFEAALADLADRLAASPGAAVPASASSPMDRLNFVVPDRAGLPALDRYAQLIMPEGARNVGYTEASRGCKHLCRHCPIVPVYQGAFRIVQPDVVVEDIRRQVEVGARHITFGDPDFFNGPAHAVRIVEALQREFPDLTYDVTIKIEHLLKHRAAVRKLKETGCLFVTTAVESVDDEVLRKLEKGHTRADFRTAAEFFRDEGLSLNPTFIAFTPWTTRQDYLDLFRTIRELDLIDQVGSVQLALRLLIPAGSRLLELPDIQRVLRFYDTESLAWTWRHPDDLMDALARTALKVVAREQKHGRSRREIFEMLWELAGGESVPEEWDRISRAAVPYLNEPWYC